jgi:hypothetical protein
VLDVPKGALDDLKLGGKRGDGDGALGGGGQATKDLLDFLLGP